MFNSTKQALLSELEMEFRTKMNSNSKRRTKAIACSKTITAILKKMMRVVSEAKYLIHKVSKVITIYYGVTIVNLRSKVINPMVFMYIYI